MTNIKAGDGKKNSGKTPTMATKGRKLTRQEEEEEEQQQMTGDQKQPIQERRRGCSWNRRELSKVYSQKLVT